MWLPFSSWARTSKARSKKSISFHFHSTSLQSTSSSIIPLLSSPLGKLLLPFLWTCIAYYPHHYAYAYYCFFFMLLPCLFAIIPRLSPCCYCTIFVHEIIIMKHCFVSLKLCYFFCGTRAHVYTLLFIFLYVRAIIFTKTKHHDVPLIWYLKFAFYIGSFGALWLELC